MRCLVAFLSLPLSLNSLCLTTQPAENNMWLAHWGQMKVFATPTRDSLATHCAFCSMTKLLFTKLEKLQFLLLNTEIIMNNDNNNCSYIKIPLLLALVRSIADSTLTLRSSFVDNSTVYSIRGKEME